MEDALSAGRVDVVVAGEDGVAAAVGAGDAVLVDVGAGGVVAAADLDAVDLPDGVHVRVVGAADADAEEEVPEVVLAEGGGALHAVDAGGLERDLALVAGAEDVLAVDGDARLVDVAPVRAPLQVELVGSGAVDDVGVDGVVGAVGRRRDDDALVLPGPRLHRRRRRVADRRGLAARCRHRVEAVVHAAHEDDVGGPEVAVPRQVDDARALHDVADPRPGAGHVPRRPDPEQAYARETEVRAIIALDDGRVMAEAVSGAGVRGRILGLDGGGQESQHKGRQS